jgi:hypothetical protein
MYEFVDLIAPFNENNSVLKKELFRYGQDLVPTIRPVVPCVRGICRGAHMTNQMRQLTPPWTPHPKKGSPALRPDVNLHDRQAPLQPEQHTPSKSLLCSDLRPSTPISQDLHRRGRHMDPTLAPGYVPPNNGKDKPSKVHHWVEVQRARAKTGSDMEDGNVADNSDTSSVSSPSTPLTQPTRPQQSSHLGAAANSDKPVMPRHPRVASWRGGRSNLSDGEGIGGPADLEEVPVGVKRQALRLDDYTFPDHRLRSVMDGWISSKKRNSL